jgi:hypothetical protein
MIASVLIQHIWRNILALVLRTVSYVHTLPKPLYAGDEVKTNHRDLPSYLQISLSLISRRNPLAGNAPEAVIFRTFRKTSVFITWTVHDHKTSATHQSRTAFFGFGRRK